MQSSNSWPLSYCNILLGCGKELDWGLSGILLYLVGCSFVEGKSQMWGSNLHLRGASWILDYSTRGDRILWTHRWSVSSRQNLLGDEPAFQGNQDKASPRCSCRIQLVVWR
jgi:hypothetical protein